MYYNITMRRSQTLLQWKSRITYCECVSVALGVKRQMRMRDIVICSLSGSTKYFHIISHTARFAKESY